MWAFMKSAPWTFAVAGLILAGAVVGVVYAVLTQMDRGFMKRDGKRLRWPKSDLPLAVAYTVDVPFEFLQAAKVAIININKLVGSKKNIIAPTMHKWEAETVGDAINTVAPSKIHILFDMLPAGAEPGGHADLRWDERDGTILACHIKMLPTLEGEQRATAVGHEFGHALGLAHDDKKSSIMHQFAGKRAKDFTKSDVKRLRKEYA